MVADVVADMLASGEAVPDALAEKTYSGELFEVSRLSLSEIFNANLLVYPPLKALIKLRN